MQAGAVNIALPHKSQIRQGVLLGHLDWFSPGRVLQEVRSGSGRVDGGDGGRKQRKWSGFAAPTALRAQR